MTISKEGLDLIKSFESCHLTAYKDPVGIWTIGWGHTDGVKQGDRITQEMADGYLQADLRTAERAVQVNVPWATQSQFDALVSFTYNCGSGNLKTLIRNRSEKEIGEALLLYNKAGGRVLNGLVRRREAERVLYFSDQEKIEDLIEFFPKYEDKIDVIFESIGASAYYAPGAVGYKARLPIAQVNGIASYKGTAEQNLMLIDLARNGRLIKPS